MKEQLAVLITNKRQFEAVVGYLDRKGFYHMKEACPKFNPVYDVVEIKDSYLCISSSNSIALSSYTVLLFDQFSDLTGVEAKTQVTIKQGNYTITVNPANCFIEIENKVADSLYFSYQDWQQVYNIFKELQ